MRSLAVLMLAIMWFTTSAACAASTLNPMAAFAGRWAVKAEGLNLIVLALDYNPNTRELRGWAYHPNQMFLAQSTVSSVSLPVEEEALVGVDANGDGLRLRFRDTKGIVSEWQFEPNGTKAATLKLTDATPGMPVSFPEPVYHLFRVGSTASVSANWDAGRVYTLDQPYETNTTNTILTKLFEEDQAGRRSAQSIDPVKLAKADAERRHATAEMLGRGELRTGLDYLHAAFIFQHGDKSKDFLLAHALALAALAKGRVDAAWITAATLDRYLQSEGKAQIYGTQFRCGTQFSPACQNPYDRDLVPDALRLQMGVPTISDQRARRSPTSSAPDCVSIAGASMLWSDPKIRFIIIGETHGTNEAPAFFGNLVCAAYDSRRSVVVAVESAEDQQLEINAFLASDGSAVAKEKFLHSALWHYSMKDGRSSKAYFDLFERLRLLRKSGRITDVVAIQPTRILMNHTTVGNNDFNAAMANRIKKAGSLYSEALVLALVGSVHASKVPVSIGAETIIPAAAQLPPSETLSLKITTGGETWDCLTKGCGVHALPGAPPLNREITIGRGAPAGFDGTVDLGTKATASPPIAVN